MDERGWETAVYEGDLSELPLYLVTPGDMADAEDFFKTMSEANKAACLIAEYPCSSIECIDISGGVLYETHQVALKQSRCGPVIVHRQWSGSRGIAIGGFRLPAAQERKDAKSG